MYNKIISNIKPLGFTWETSDPFLFCVHHLDNYPPGNEQLGPAASLEGRILGQDFTLREGWRMYHGEKVPGFPTHPHRGFETITVVLKGFVDHSDSYGAYGRYGMGDVQWMTAGAGLQHSEMFPLLSRDAPNHLELFQIWLNLPRARKFAKPFYKMLWAEDIPIYETRDKSNRLIKVRVIAGSVNHVNSLLPAPDSWASESGNEIGIWLIKMEPQAQWTLPMASFEINRSLYFYEGSAANIEGIRIYPNHSLDLLPDQPVVIENGLNEASFLLLQGKPISEPVVQHGPFVMNTAEEIHQAFLDYRFTGFGGWPWESYENVHGKDQIRFARYEDGTEEVKGQKMEAQF